MGYPFLIVPKPKTIDDLDLRLRSSNLGNNKLELRKSVEIAIIDDEEFHPKSNLSNLGFVLTTYKDISKIELVQRYQIILCDIQGVGKELSPTSQGAFLMKEIKTHYPDKWIIAYTAGAPSANIEVMVNEYANAFIKKDEDIPTWTEKLDNAIAEVVNPVSMWKRFRLTLLEKNIPLLDLVSLEAGYVKACMQANSPTPEKFVRNALTNNSSRNITSAVEEFLSSPLFKIAIQLAKVYVGFK